MTECFVIIAVNFIFYFKTLRFGYCSDDLPANKRPKHPSRFWHWLGVLEGRARSQPQIDHLITLLIHTATAVMLYLGFGANDISFLAALLFSVNPISDQASIWIAGRPYALTALGLTSLLTMPVLAPLILLVTTWTNAGFVIPVMFLASPVPWVVAFLPLCWGIHFRRFRKNVGEKVKMEMFAEDRKIHWRKLVLAIKTFGFYLSHALVPIRTTFYHAFLQSAAGCMKDRAFTMKDRYFWLGLAGIAGMTWYWATYPWNMVSFGLVWWCIGIAPFLNLVRIHQEIAQRYCYAPLPGLMFVLASVLISHPVLAGAWLAMYATKMWFWMNAYKDDFSLVEMSRTAEPMAWFVWHVSAMKRWDVGSTQEAIIFWTMARNISPKEFKLNFNLATAMKLAKHDKDAEILIKTAMENVPAGQEQQILPLYKEWQANKMAILL